MAIANTSAVLDSLFLAVGSMALYRHRGHNRRHFILFQEAVSGCGGAMHAGRPLARDGQTGQESTLPRKAEINLDIAF